jgi:hypothetical protein
MNEPSRSRGVSEVVGYLLLFAITAIALAVLLSLGSDALTGLQTQLTTESAEQSVESFAAAANMVAFDEGAGQQRVRLAAPGAANTLAVSNDGAVKITQTYLSNGTTNVLVNETLSSLVLAQDEAEVTYQGGGVWARDAEGSRRIVAAPPMSADGESLILPFISLDNLLIEGNDVYVERTSSERYSFGSVSQNQRLRVQVTSEYYAQWGAVWESMVPNASVTYDSTNTTAMLAIPKLPTDETIRSVEQAPGTLSPKVAVNRYKNADDVESDIEWENTVSPGCTAPDRSIVSLDTCNGGEHIYHPIGPGAREYIYVRIDNPDYRGADAYFDSDVTIGAYGDGRGNDYGTTLLPQDSDVNMVVDGDLNVEDGGAAIVDQYTEDFKGRIYVNGNLIVDNGTVGSIAAPERLEIIVLGDASVQVKNGGRLYGYVHYANPSGASPVAGCADGTVCVEDTATFWGGTNGAITNSSDSDLKDFVDDYTPDVRERRTETDIGEELDFVRTVHTSGSATLEYLYITLTSVGEE